MRNRPDQAKRRRERLLGRLRRGQTISTERMARTFGVSAMTIRRDLKALSDSGAAVRCYGGALAAQRITFEFAFDEARRRNLPQKRRIGAEAAGRIQPQQTVFLDTGTTTLEIARALARRALPCSVVTSSLVVASELWGREPIELLLLGGRVRRGSPDLVGPATEAVLERLTADIAFLGSEGIDVRRGFFAEDMETARISERMVANSTSTIVVADSSKLGRTGPARFATIEQIDELITDKRAAPAMAKGIAKKGTRVTLA